MVNVMCDLEETHTDRFVAIGGTTREEEDTQGSVSYELHCLRHDVDTRNRDAQRRE